VKWSFFKRFQLRHGVPPPPARLGFREVKLRFAEFVPGDPERGFVPYYHFRIEVGREDVGHINFRVEDNEHIRMTAGHIGYEVRPEWRGHGYAGQACRALAPFVRQLRPDVIVTADPDNIASLRTIEGLGAQFLDEVPVPAFEPAYGRGSLRKRRYLWVP